jgi:hypothetical protein
MSWYLYLVFLSLFGIVGLIILLRVIFVISLFLMGKVILTIFFTLICLRFDKFLEILSIETEIPFTFSLFVYGITLFIIFFIWSDELKFKLFDKLEKKEEKKKVKEKRNFFFKIFDFFEFIGINQIIGVIIFFLLIGLFVGLSR